MKLKIFILIPFVISSFCFSQSIKGVVLDAITLEPIESASIYYDNTTVGTASNFKGEFEIEYDSSITSPLIISFIGYETTIVPDYTSKKIYKILLNKSDNELNEVVIYAFDGMPKKTKLKHFRTHFLGDTKNGKSCTILNEEDLNLRYNKRTRQLVVTSKAPILVRNDNLQYDIKYDLKNFTIDYGHVNVKKRVFIPNSVVYKGTSFFESLSEERSVQKKRKILYKGSVIHFMRALASNQLKKEGFNIICLGYIVDPNNYIRITKVDTSNSVNVKLRLPLTIDYKKWKVSNMRLPDKNGKFDRHTHRELVNINDSVVAEKTTKILKGTTWKEDVEELWLGEIENKYYYNLYLTIDEYGNYSPLGSFYFTGYFSELRVGDTLPLDYALKD